MKTISDEKNAAEKALIGEVRAVASKYHIQEVDLISAKDICVAHWVRLKCKYGCKNYAKSWCCPPETPSPEQTKALLEEYEKAFLLSGAVRNGHFYRDNQKKRRVQVSIWKGTVAVERMLFLAGYYKAFGLASESCALCRECAYPNECAFPIDKRPSVESCSIDIFQTLKNIGKSFRIAKDVKEEYRSYSLILLE